MKEHFVQEARKLASEAEGLPRDQIVECLQTLRQLLHTNIGKIITYDLTPDHQDRHYDQSAFIAIKEYERSIMAVLRGEQVSDQSYTQILEEEIDHENRLHFAEKRENINGLSTLEQNAMEMILEGHNAFVLLKQGAISEAVSELQRFCETEQYLFERIIFKQMQPDDGGAIDIYAYILASYYHLFSYFFSQSFLKRDVFMKYHAVRDKYKVHKKTPSAITIGAEEEEFLQKTYRLVKEMLPYSKNCTDLNSVYYLHGCHELISRWYALLQNENTQHIALSYLRVQDRSCVDITGDTVVKMRDQILTSYPLAWQWLDAKDYASLINAKCVRFSHVGKK